MPVVAAASTPEPAPVAAPTQSLAQVVSSVSSAVVMISARQGFGSGFIIDKHGYILTAGHVVAGLSSVTVTLADGTEEPGLVIGRDEIRDLGMIKISGREDLPVARLGNVADIGVGVAVMALGHADFKTTQLYLATSTAAGRRRVGRQVRRLQPPEMRHALAPLRRHGCRR